MVHVQLANRAVISIQPYNLLLVSMKIQSRRRLVNNLFHLRQRPRSSEVIHGISEKSLPHQVCHTTSAHKS